MRTKARQRTEIPKRKKSRNKMRGSVDLITPKIVKILVKATENIVTITPYTPNQDNLIVLTTKMTRLEVVID